MEKVHYKKPLYRKNGRTYWKGIPTDDDKLSQLMDNNPEEVRAYNKCVRIADRKRNYWIKRRNQIRRNILR